jgi:hypothetical protein
MEDKIRIQQVFQGILEVFATHYLVRHVRQSTEEETTRMVVGASMAGLGYFFGPKIQDRLRDSGSTNIQQYLKDNMLYAAGGALLGSVTGYTLGPTVAKSMQSRQLEERVQSIETPSNGLLVVASAGWLGYSLFLNGKTSRERDRHLWGLGAGAVGYLYAPELLHKMKSQTVPSQANEETIQIYSKGTAILGGLAGGLLGLVKGKDILNQGGST